MSDTVKLIIEIPKTPKNDHERWVLAHGIPLDDVIAKIDDASDDLDGYDPDALHTFINRVNEILDNIGKADMRGDKVE